MSTVEHPDHYGGDVPTEPIKVIRAWGMNFALGNAVKYLSRAGRKDPAKKVEDLSKAIFYIEDEIERGEQARRHPIAALSSNDLGTISMGLRFQENSNCQRRAREVIERLRSEIDLRAEEIIEEKD